MRNGNNELNAKFGGLDSGSYRTYEEWKHIPPVVIDTTWTTVLTVPMRNGNDGIIHAPFIVVVFLPYL